MNFEVFIKHLRQVIEKTEVLSTDFDMKNDNLATVFRSSNPVINGVELYSFDDDYVTWNLDDYNFEIYKALMASVFPENATVANKKSYTSLPGRILLFETTLTTHDGMAIVDTCGFLDESDAPPIDTWFYLTDSFMEIEHPVVFCWIPEQFVTVMETGVEFSITQCYQWLDEKFKDVNNKVIELLQQDQ